MDKKETTAFTPSQIKRLREQLCKYKEINHCSWMEVTRDLIESETNDFVLPEKPGKNKEDDHWPIKEKMISRFGGKEKRIIRDKKILQAIRDFLEDYDLWNPSFDEASITRFREAFELSKYFLKGNHNRSIPWRELDLSGNYKMGALSADENKPRSLTFDLFESEGFYEVEERIFFRSRSAMKKILKEGWANITSFGALLVFLQEKGEKTQNIYLGQSLKIYEDKSVEVNLQPFQPLQFIDRSSNVTLLKQPTKNQSSAPLCFIKETSESFLKKSA